MLKNSPVWWSFWGKVGSQVVGFFVSLWMARTIGPEAYGIYGAAFVAVQFLRYLEGGGILSAMVQSRRDVELPVTYADAYVRKIGLLLAVIAALAAWPVATFFGQEAVRPVIWVLAGSIIVRSWGIVPLARLTKNILVSRVVGARLIGLATGSVVGIAWAAHSPDVWALVALAVAQDLAQTIALRLSIANVVPDTSKRLQAFRDMRKFGWKVIFGELVSWFHLNAWEVLTGRFVGTNALAYVRLSRSVVERPLSPITEVVSGVVFPTMASYDVADAKLTWRTSFVFLVYLTAVWIYVMGILGGSVIVVMLGQDWLPLEKLIRYAGMLQSIVLLYAFQTRAMTVIGRPLQDGFYQLAGVLSIGAWLLVIRFGMNLPVDRAEPIAVSIVIGMLTYLTLSFLAIARHYEITRLATVSVLRPIILLVISIFLVFTYEFPRPTDWTFAFASSTAVVSGMALWTIFIDPDTKELIPAMLYRRSPRPTTLKDSVTKRGYD